MATERSSAVCLYVYGMYNVRMEEYSYIDFEWDDRKAEANELKHGVTFESASEVFSDPHALFLPDKKHSDYEERFFLIGMDLSPMFSRFATASDAAGRSSGSSLPGDRPRTRRGSIGGAEMSRAYEDIDMPEEIDFSEAVKNPYVGKVRRRVTINIDGDTVDYFKEESRRTGVPYQTIINLYLGQCAKEGKRLAFV